MNRSQRIVSLLEGFKLGKLGARSTNPVEDSPVAIETDSRVEDIKWYRKNKKSREGWLGGVSWSEISEASGWYNNFFLVLDMSEDQQYYRIGVYGGGEYLKIINYGYEVGARHHAFDIEYDFKASDDMTAITKMKAVFGKIKEVGSFGSALASGQIGSGWQIYFEEHDYFKDYLQRKTGSHRSPHIGTT
jgi:hypothetical protein